MPIVFKYKNYSIRFFSNEEKRAHVHAVSKDGGEVKIWLIPHIEVAKINGVTEDMVNEILSEVKKKKSQCMEVWNDFFRE
ncbi:MAG: DUF4160 domain-containing protein [Lentisphaerota bacterium]